MAKPILTVRIGNERDWTDFIEIKKRVTEETDNEYHVIVYGGEPPEIKIEVFYEKDHKPIDIEGLKELIKNQHNGKEAV